MNLRSQQCCYACKEWWATLPMPPSKRANLMSTSATLIKGREMNISPHACRNSHILPLLLQSVYASWVGDVTVSCTRDGLTCLCWEDIHVQLNPDGPISVQNLSGTLKPWFTACSVRDTGKKVPHEIKYLSFRLSIFLPWVCRHAECEMLEQAAWCVFLEPCLLCTGCKPHSASM